MTDFTNTTNLTQTDLADNLAKMTLTEQSTVEAISIEQEKIDVEALLEDAHMTVSDLTASVIQANNTFVNSTVDQDMDFSDKPEVLTYEKLLEKGNFDATKITLSYGESWIRSLETKIQNEQERIIFEQIALLKNTVKKDDPNFHHQNMIALRDFLYVRAIASKGEGVSAAQKAFDTRLFAQEKINPDVLVQPGIVQAQERGGIEVYEGQIKKDLKKINIKEVLVDHKLELLTNGLINEKNAHLGVNASTKCNREVKPSPKWTGIVATTTKEPALLFSFKAKQGDMLRKRSEKDCVTNLIELEELTLKQAAWTKENPKQGLPDKLKQVAKTPKLGVDKEYVSAHAEEVKKKKMACK